MGVFSFPLLPWTHMTLSYSDSECCSIKISIVPSDQLWLFRAPGRGLSYHLLFVASYPPSPGTLIAVNSWRLSDWAVKVQRKYTGWYYICETCNWQASPLAGCPTKGVAHLLLFCIKYNDQFELSNPLAVNQGLWTIAETSDFTKILPLPNLIKSNS